MLFADFIAQERKDLQQFEHWWRCGHIDHPDSFPISMMSGDWDEQYLLWKQSDKTDYTPLIGDTKGSK